MQKVKERTTLQLNKDKKSWYETLFGAFEDEENMKTYYEVRKPYMIKIYWFMVAAKIGHIVECTRGFYKTDYRSDNQRLLERYPATPEGDQAFITDSCLATA